MGQQPIELRLLLNCCQSLQYPQSMLILKILLPKRVFEFHEPIHETKQHSGAKYLSYKLLHQAISSFFSLPCKKGGIYQVLLNIPRDLLAVQEATNVEDYQVKQVHLLELCKLR